MKTSEPSPTGAGGAAAHAGTDFQNRVCAWIATRVLAGVSARSPWGLPADVALTSLRSETERPTDDLMATTSAGGQVFVQAKRTLSLGEKDPDLASSMDQFVRQFRLWRDEAAWPAGSGDPLHRHRLVLAVSEDAPATVKRDLHNALVRLRGREAGAPPDAIMNAREREAYRIVRSHVERAWVSRFGGDPSDDVLALLDLVWVQAFDLDAGGRDELEAKTLLRTAVIQDPPQDDAAWNALVAQGAQYAKTRTGGDYRALAQVFSDAGIALQVPRHYRDDVERLKQFSSRALDTLRERSRFALGPYEVRIEREVVRVLYEELEEASILVVGDPGMGKSVVLEAVATAWAAAGRDVVVIAADSMRADSLGQLRDEIGLTRGVLEVLEHWPDAETGLVVIDALDAARTDPSTRTLRDLIAGIGRLGDRWRVVASVRSYDLRYGEEWRRMFKGSPAAAFSAPEFPHIRHVRVPPLSDEDLRVVAAQAPPLGVLFEAADDQLLALLRVPFNLHLAAELLDAGVPLPELSRVQTQVQLLDAYWRRRVLSTPERAAEWEAVLGQVTEAMVRDRRLNFDRRTIVDPQAATVISELLHNHVLVEGVSTPSTGPSRGLVAFTHNILFDYAVATLLLETRRPGEFAELLANERDLAIAIRPSLTLHFQRAWDGGTDRQEFWSLALTLMAAEHVPETGRIVGPAIAATAARTLDDLRPLLGAIDRRSTAFPGTPARLLRHVVHALLAADDPHLLLVGDRAGPWCELASTLLDAPTPEAVWALRPLLWDLYNDPTRWTERQRELLGRSARRLLAYVRAAEPVDLPLATAALRGVCRTYRSDPDASAALVRETLEPGRMAQFGFKEIPLLGDEVAHLTVVVPDLVEDIYRAAFTFDETSEAAVHMGDDIFGLASIRRQDYDLGLHTLGGAYPRFLSEAPREALRVIDVAVDELQARGGTHSKSFGAISTFEFGDSPAEFRSDGSAWWDGLNIRGTRDPNGFLDAFQSQLDELARTADHESDRLTLLQVLVAEPRPASLWRRLLVVGAAHPETLGWNLRQLAYSPAILLGADTTEPAGRFVEQLFPTLGSEERERVERAIVAIPDEVPDQRRHAYAQVRDRLLARLPADGLVTNEARRLCAAAGATSDRVVSIIDGLNSDEPMLPPWSPLSEPSLAPQGLDVEVLNLVRSAVQQATQHQQGVFTEEQIVELTAGLSSVHEALGNEEQVRSLSVARWEEAWQRLAMAASWIAFSPNGSCASELGTFAKSVLLDAARFPGFKRTSGHEDSYDSEHGFVPDENPRAVAARGLLRLAFSPSCVDPDLTQAIEALAGDPDPAVRLAVATDAYALHASAPEAMWRILERACRYEERWGVVFWALNVPLQFVGNASPNRTADLAADVLKRAVGEEQAFVRRASVELLVDLYLRYDHPRSREILDSVAEHPAVHANEVEWIARHIRMRRGFVEGAVDRPDGYVEALRARAFDLIERIVRRAAAQLRDLYAEVERRDDRTPTPEEQLEFEGLVKALDAVAHEIHFASGAYDERRHSTTPDDQPLPPDVKRRFLREARPVLDALAEAGQPRIAYELLRTLEAYVSVDPVGVWMGIALVIRQSRVYGVQLRPMAADLVVELVDRYLADYRNQIWGEPMARDALVDILDGFVEVGWPRALRLAYRLDQMYR